MSENKNVSKESPKTQDSPKTNAPSSKGASIPKSKIEKPPKKKSKSVDKTSKNEAPNTKGSKRFSKKTFLLVSLILMPMLCCAASLAAILLYNSYIFSYVETDPYDTFDSANPYPIAENDNVSSYLGYEEVEVTVADNGDFHDQLYILYDNFEALALQEELIETAIAGEDVESFFIASEKYNQVGAEMIAQADAIDDYLTGNTEEGGGGVGSLFIKRAYAKERSSLWYYIPVFGSLLKAKHQSIETARAGMYDYLKNEMPAVDRDQLLSDNNLSNIEDLRTATDSQIEYLAKNTELRVGIDWTKLSTEAGKQAVIATVDGYKIASSANPIKSVGTGSAMRYFTEKGGPVQDQIPDAGDRVTIVSPTEVKDALDKIDPGVDKKWSQYSDKERALLTDTVSSLIEEKSLLTLQKSNANGVGEKFRLPPDFYEVLTVTNDTAPLIVTTVEVENEKVTEVLVPYTGLEIYALDPEVSTQLGFGLNPIQVDVEVTSCMDVGEVDQYNQDNSNVCDSSFISCLESPVQYSDGYSECVGGGGCWDIGRWEYVNQDNCEIGSDNKLNYDNSYFDEDFEYSPGGNLAYCECIVKCREEHSEPRDCEGELRTCCESFID